MPCDVVVCCCKTLSDSNLEWVSRFFEKRLYFGRSLWMWKKRNSAKRPLPRPLMPLLPPWEWDRLLLEAGHLDCQESDLRRWKALESEWRERDDPEKTGSTAFESIICPSWFAWSLPWWWVSEGADRLDRVCDVALVVFYIHGSVSGSGHGYGWWYPGTRLLMWLFMFSVVVVVVLCWWFGNHIWLAHGWWEHLKTFRCVCQSWCCSVRFAPLGLSDWSASFWPWPCFGTCIVTSCMSSMNDSIMLVNNDIPSSCVKVLLLYAGDLGTMFGWLMVRALKSFFAKFVRVDVVCELHRLVCLTDPHYFDHSLALGLALLWLYVFHEWFCHACKQQDSIFSREGAGSAGCGRCREWTEVALIRPVVVVVCLVEGLHCGLVILACFGHAGKSALA